MTIFFVFLIIILFLLGIGLSLSSGDFGATSEAFIFSLNNNEGLAPFLTKVKKEHSREAIYRNSTDGPIFGNDVIVAKRFAIILIQSTARLGFFYSVPSAVQDPLTVMAGTESFSPDEVEVLYLDPSR